MKKKAIGLMSGTSLDGIDVLIADINHAGLKTSVDMVHANTYAYHEPLLRKIKQAISQETSTSKLICSLNHELAEAYAECVFAVCREAGVDLNDIAFIASHGQTIYHIAEKGKGCVPSSLQLGDGSVLANLTKTTVVSNFRTADIAAGGSGAPLVSFADYLLFRDKKKGRLLQNIGGISNVTCVPKNAAIDDVFAFDNGPGNMMINRAMERLFQKPYDQDGLTAKKGKIVGPLLDTVFSNPYFHEKPPKSTGREIFGISYTDALLKTYDKERPEDIIATLTEVTAKAIMASYKEFIFPHHRIDEVIVSGGGAHNKALIKRLKSYAEMPKFRDSDDDGIPVDYKEALAFIILANETLHHRPSNVPGATGAATRVVLGQISPVIK